MKKLPILALSGLLASLVVGCGGGDNGKTPSASSLGTAFASASGGGAAAAPATRWASVKFGGGGYVPGLIFHPTNAQVLYARTDVGGAYRWNAASASWEAITDFMSVVEGHYHSAESMAIDPNDDRRVYMAAGMYLSENPDGRLYISSDRGDNWTHVDLPFSIGGNNQGRAVGERLMVDPNLPSVLFYGSRASGLWRSADYGQTWQQVSSLSSHKMSKEQIEAVFWKGVVGVEQVIFDTSTKGSGTPTQTIYTAVAPDYAAVAGLTHSLYKSTDGGASWTPVATPVDGYYIPHMVRNKDGMMYVAFTQGTGPGANGAARLYKFDGSNWTLLKSYDPTQWTSFGMGGLSVSGTGANTRIALGVTNTWGNWEGQPVVQLSDDGGATWREIAAMAPHNPSGIGFSGWTDDVEIDPSNPERILHVSGGGVWETRNASAAKPTWNFIINGIEETATEALMAPPPRAGYSLLRSALDTGTHVQTELLKTPTRAIGNLASASYADMAWGTPSYIAATGNANHDTPDIVGAYSTDASLTWSKFPANHPDAKANQGGASNLAVVKPGHVVWAPANSVPAYTLDGGATWTYTNLPPLANAWVPRAYRLAADRKNPNKVYAYNPGGAWWNQWSEKPRFFVSTDGGRTFAESLQFADSGAVNEVNHRTSIAVNPNAEGDIWLVDGARIFHSVDSGATWTRLDAAAPIWGSHQFEPKVHGATSIALGKAPAGASYSASVYIVGVIDGVWGVHRSDDGGATWRRFNDDKHQFGGIGTLAADHSVPGRLYLSGGGRGVFFSY